MLQLFQFLVGVTCLCLGASWLVRGASSIAITFGIPKHVIGLTLVALGTSAPEFFVNVLAALHGNTDFALSNVSGSNLANMCVGFGLCALLATAQIRRRDFGSDLMLTWLIPLVVLVLMFTNSELQVPIWTIVPLTIFLFVYLGSLRGRRSSEEAGEVYLSLRMALISFVVGIVGLSVGGEMVLRAAVKTAEIWGVPEDLIGLTIVAFGTSVPDITASVVAARKGEHGIAVGNLIGSNISNLVVVLNSTVAVSLQALDTTPGVRWDYLAVTVVSVFCCWLGMTRERVPRWAAGVLLVAYVGYLAARAMQH